MASQLHKEVLEQTGPLNIHFQLLCVYSIPAQLHEVVLEQPGPLKLCYILSYFTAS